MSPLSSAVDSSAVARVLGIAVNFKDLRGGNTVFLPQRIMVVGQGSTLSTYSLLKAQVTSAQDVAETYGFGSPLHLAVKQLLPANGDGVGTIPVTVYPLDDDVGGVASGGTITATGTTATEAGSFRVRIGGILSGGISVAIGDDVTAVALAISNAMAAELDMPATGIPTLGVVATTSKWKGSSANHIGMEVIGTVPAGITVDVVQMASGAVNPDVDDALAQVGDVWETMVLNCMELSDDTTLDKFQVFGEARWGALTHKPLVVFTGVSSAALVDVLAITDARTLDRVNVVLNGMGSPDTKFAIAARLLSRIAKVANNNPPQDYAGQQGNGLTSGTDGEQWDYLERNSAVSGGASTTVVNGGIIVIDDVVTMYHPAGDQTPAYRYVVDIVKLQNVIFNFALIFTAEGWAGAPLIPNDQPTHNPTAKQPKAAVAAINAKIDGLGQDAIISDPEAAKATTDADINGSNPKRLDAVTTVQVSGNVNITSVDLNFGFFFGG